MALESINLPLSVLLKSPKFDRLVVSTRTHSLAGRMETDPVDSFLVTLKDMFDLYVEASEQIVWLRS